MKYQAMALALSGTLLSSLFIACNNQKGATEPTPTTGNEGKAEESPVAENTSPPAEATATSAPGEKEADADRLTITISVVGIDTKLAMLCGISGSSVFFKYDSAKLRPDAKERLEQLAKCVTSGAAKGKTLLVIGQTDPRGSDEYNKQLGMSRAESVAKYLRELGVSQTNLEVSSKGEEMAMKDPYGWSLDRRVTIHIK